MQIVSRWDDTTILWEGEAGTVCEAVYAALKSGANLGGADLRGADLGGADLRGADLGGADLRGADLGGADLRGADLRGANLGDANLGGADLGGADLRGANLGDADLGGANLRGANLGGADLGDANLVMVRDDIWAILSAAPAEVPTLLAKLRAGEVDGSCYEGACACLVGTIANARGCDYHDLAPLLQANAGRPAEAFFAAIRPGDTPETSQPAQLAVEWIADWLTRMRLAFSTAGQS
jgi:pentapeptide repeat protein